VFEDDELKELFEVEKLMLIAQAVRSAKTL